MKRRSGGAIAIAGNVQEISVPEIPSDVEDFRRAITSSAWAHAADIYIGQLFDARLEGAEGFNEWIDGLRATYAEMAASVWLSLRLDGAEAYAAALAARLPPSWLELDGMRPTDGIVGQHDLTPLPVLTESSSDDPKFFREVSGTPFVGRTNAIDALVRSLGEISHFGCVVVEGEPGIGKTALANRFSRLCAIRGRRVLAAKGFGAEQNVPFGIVAQWLRQLTAEDLLGLSPQWRATLELGFPGIHETSEDAAVVAVSTGEYRIVEALRQLMIVFSSRQPTVLVLDDAQFADAASIGFLHYLARRSPDARVFLVSTLRSPLLHGSDPFASWRDVKRLEIGPLSVAETNLLADKLGASPGGSAKALELFRRTGGNPLLLMSLLRDGSSSDVAIPDSVLEFFVPRLKMLSREALLLLAGASVADDTASLAVAGRIAGIGDVPQNCEKAAAELADAGLLQSDDGDTVVPRHGIVSEICVAQLSAIDRKGLYGRAARILGEEGRVPPAVLAVQHDIAGERERAYVAARSAAAASKELNAVREEEFFLKLALSNAPDVTTEMDIRLQLADLLREMGRLSDSADVMAESRTARIDERRRAAAQARRLLVNLSTTGTPETVAMAWYEIDNLKDRIGPEILAELYIAFASAAHDAGERLQIVEAANRALSLLNRLPLTPETGRIAARAAKAIGLYSSSEQGLAAIDKVMPVAGASGGALGHCLAARATLLVAAGRLNEAESSFLEAIQLIERFCQFRALLSVRNNLGVCYIDQGRYEDSLVELQEAAKCAREFGGGVDPGMVGDNLAVLHLESGNYQLAVRTARSAIDDARAFSSRGLFHRHALIGLSSLELGFLAQAFEAKREIELLLDQREYWSSDVSYVETFLSRMLVLEGRADAARKRLETAIEIYRARDLMCRSRLELELGRVELRTDPAAAVRRGEAMLATLRGTGARPLIERFEELVDRARARSG